MYPEILAHPGHPQRKAVLPKYSPRVYSNLKFCFSAISFPLWFGGFFPVFNKKGGLFLYPKVTFSIEKQPLLLTIHNLWSSLP